MPFVKVANFSGLNNRVDPTALGLEWQLTAQNTLCDNARYHILRPGYEEFIPNISDAYGTDDGRLFVVDSLDRLFEVDIDGALHQRAAGFSGGKFQWAEIEYAIFALSETTAWCIYPDRVVRWGIDTLSAPTVSLTNGNLNAGVYLAACILISPDGRMGGCDGIASIQVESGQGIIINYPETPGYTTQAYLSTADGKLLYRAGNLSSSELVISTNPAKGPRLRTQNLYPPPIARIISAHGNRMCVAVWEPEHNRTVLYWSVAEAPHLFNLETDYQTVSGKPMILAESQGSLLIGTDRGLFAYQAGTSVQQLSNYGAREDTARRLDSGQIVFWTERGMCRFPPFENLTESNLIPNVYLKSTASLLRYKGSTYLIVSQLGNECSDSPRSPYIPLSVEIT